MNSAVRRRERERFLSVGEACRSFGARIEAFLSPSTVEEQERRHAHVVALLLVAVSSTVMDVIGLTDGSATFTVYLVAVAASARFGGLAPATVAALAAFLLASARSAAAADWTGRIVFVAASLLLIGLIGGVTRRLREATSQLTRVQASNDALRGEVLRGHLTRLALHHLEETATDAAIFAVNAHGMIVEWPQSAERMYGYTAEQVVGASLGVLLAAPAGTKEPQDLLSQAARGRHLTVHRRSDGTRIHLEVRVKPCGPQASEWLTVAVQDQAHRRESEDFREAALRAQAALQKTADEAQRQVAALESLTDPAVSPGTGAAAIGELLERLRATLQADGVALVQVGQAGTRMVSGAGLRPSQVRAPGAATGSAAAANGRVALVHNDVARVAQVSALTWPGTVSSLIVVPVCRTGPSAFTIEVVNERRAAATEWDLALARIVADRLTLAVAH